MTFNGTGIRDLTCKKCTHKTTRHMQSRDGFGFGLRGSVIAAVA